MRLSLCMINSDIINIPVNKKQQKNVVLMLGQHLTRMVLHQPISANRDYSILIPLLAD